MIGQRSNTLGVAMLLSVVHVVTRELYWSKDLIVLFPDRGSLGVQTWARAYHSSQMEPGSSGSAMPRFSSRYGALQAALFLDFESTTRIENCNNIVYHIGQAPLTRIPLGTLAHTLVQLCTL